MRQPDTCFVTGTLYGPRFTKTLETCPLQYLYIMAKFFNQIVLLNY